jgi:uncharacterized protein YegJ (DUF2314 family)
VKPVRIPLAASVRSTHVVYFAGPAPDAKELGALWMDGHVPAPLGPVLERYVGSDLVEVVTRPRNDLPVPDLELLRLMRLGEDEERRLAAATHGQVVQAEGLLQHPLLHVWATLAVARAAALASGGVVLDPELPRVLPAEQHDAPLRGHGRVAVAEQIVVPTSRRGDGTMWITTKGMRRFGLPNLEVRAVPPGLASDLVPVVDGVAQLLLDTALGRAQEAGERGLDALVLPRPLELTLGDVARSFGKEPDGGGGRVAIALRWDGRGRDGMEPFVERVPPDAHVGDRGEWLYSVLRDLVGATEDPAVTGDAEALREAHERARRELPSAKQRFCDGLPPGSTLYVKYGFPVPEGGREYMWVAVESWHEDVITGALSNDSAYRADLRAGRRVRVPAGDVFDWMITHGRNKREGGYTIDVLTH